MPPAVGAQRMLATGLQGSPSVKSLGVRLFLSSCYANLNTWFSFLGLFHSHSLAFTMTIKRYSKQKQGWGGGLKVVFLSPELSS